MNTTGTGAADVAVSTPSANPWQVRIESFAGAVNKPASDIVSALTPLVGEPGNDALEIISDSTAVTDDDLVAVLVKDGPKIPSGVFRKNLKLLRGAPAAPAATPSGTPASPSFDVLPSVPDDSSFLEMLKVGGVLKVGPTEVLSAIKAALAFRLGVYELPSVIVDKMESFADSQDEPVGESFFKLRKLVVSKSYGDILSVLGVEGNFISETRKKTFLSRLDQMLWSEVESFYQRMLSWQESWMSTAANPAMALSMLAMAQGGSGGIMPPGMMQPPDTASLRDAAEEVINKINKVFAGVGIPVARALAYDATRIKGVLEDASLPAQIGAANKEQMLKLLGVSVGADYVRLERNMARFVMSAMEYPKVASGQAEYAYLAAMLQLGASIPWDKLPGTARAGIGRSRSAL